ncbi:hypothetical protein, partial [Acetobacter aceti]|uniref:hypothetical protein n=1 Tax=Acetobacter aceti TaxID=435 RepID=UPI0006623A41
LSRGIDDDVDRRGQSVTGPPDGLMSENLPLWLHELQDTFLQTTMAEYKRVDAQERPSHLFL